MLNRLLTRVVVIHFDSKGPVLAREHTWYGGDSINYIGQRLLKLSFCAFDARPFVLYHGGRNEERIFTLAADISKGKSGL